MHLHLRLIKECQLPLLIQVRITHQVLSKLLAGLPLQQMRHLVSCQLPFQIILPNYRTGYELESLQVIHLHLQLQLEGVQHLVHIVEVVIPLELREQRALMWFITECVLEDVRRFKETIDALFSNIKFLNAREQ